MSILNMNIGEAENVLDRLNQHLRDYNSDKKILLEFSCCFYWKGFK